jgi:DNA-directed RNA polymerase subunit RPC12/RpoP
MSHSLFVVTITHGQAVIGRFNWYGDPEKGLAHAIARTQDIGILSLGTILPENLVYNINPKEVFYCADCGDRTDDPVTFAGTSVRCPACHSRRMRGE